MTLCYVAAEEEGVTEEGGRLNVQGMSVFGLLCKKITRQTFFFHFTKLTTPLFIRA